MMSMAIKQMGIRMDTKRPEYRCYTAQKSSLESLTRLIDETIKHTKMKINNTDKESTVDLSKTTDS